MSTLTAPAMKLKTGLDPTSRVNFKDIRGFSFHGMGAFVGTGRAQRAHVYTAASIPVDPEAYKQIDPERLAHELGVDMCAVNRGRFWMMDEIDFLVGEVQDFHGVEMRWAGDMTGAEMISQFESAYVPSLIYRNTNWIFYAGKPVYLLRDPEGATWVLQEFTKDVDPSLTADNLQVLGEQLQGAARGLDVRDEGARPRTFRSTRPARAAGPRSSATSSTAHTRAAATAQTAAPATCPDPDERSGAGASRAAGSGSE